MKIIIKALLASVIFILLPVYGSMAQTASCNIAGGADWYEYAYEICGGTFNIDISETIFHEARNFNDTAPTGLCKDVYPLSVYPPDVYGKQWVAMTITEAADPDTVLAQCEYEHIHSRAAAVEIVLDKSGSMGSGNKLQAAITAAQAFIDTIIPIVTIRPGPLLRSQHYGVVLYNSQAQFLDIEPLVPVGEVDYVTPAPGTNASVVQYLQYVQAGGTTSIGAGLQLARNALEANVTPDDEPYERMAILVLSDGMENTAPWINDELPALLNRGIPVYTIGFGADYQIDVAKLQQLSADTGGGYRHTDNPDDLSKFFMEVLVDNYADTHMLLDPKGTVSSSAPQTHIFPVTEADQAITVVLTWRDPANNLGLQLSAPPLIVSESNIPPGIKVVDRHLAYKIYSVPVCQESEEKNCAQPGDWTVTISAPSGVSEAYSLTVLSQSDAHLGIGLPFTAFYIGETLPISAQLLVGGKPVDGAKITVSISVPNENAFHRIAAAKIDAKSLSKLRSVDGKRLWREKKAALVYQGKPVPRKQYTVTLNPQKPARSGWSGYIGKLEATKHPGSYDLNIRAEWETRSGRKLIREATRSIYIAAKPTENSKIDVTVLGENTKTGTRIVRIDFTPIDRFANLLGLGLADQIQLTGITGKLASFKDLGNGSYRLKTEIPREWNSLRLQMNDNVWRVGIPLGYKSK